MELFFVASCLQLRLGVSVALVSFLCHILIVWTDTNFGIWLYYQVLVTLPQHVGSPPAHLDKQNGSNWTNAYIPTYEEPNQSENAELWLIVISSVV